MTNAAIPSSKSSAKLVFASILVSILFPIVSLAEVPKYLQMFAKSYSKTWETDDNFFDCGNRFKSFPDSVFDTNALAKYIEVYNLIKQLGEIGGKCSKVPEDGQSFKKSDSSEFREVDQSLTRFLEHL